MTSTNKQKIEEAFDRGANNYDWAAVIQKDVAKNLMDMIPPKSPKKILEIGCGTGFLTNLLLQKYLKSDITAIDISAKMIEKCRKKLPSVEFLKADAELYLPQDKYDLIISNMTFQWFEKPNDVIEKYKEKLNKNGVIIFSTTGQDNIREWNDSLKRVRLPSGVLPSKEYQGIVKEEKIKTMYQNSMDFVRALKDIGASHSHSTPLSPVQLKAGCNAFKDKYQCSLTWHILYGKIEKN